jgi:GTP cyclohydrolase I
MGLQTGSNNFGRAEVAWGACNDNRVAIGYHVSGACQHHILHFVGDCTVKAMVPNKPVECAQACMTIGKHLRDIEVQN